MSDDGHDFEDAERRAHHNHMERRRRNELKDSFVALKQAIPSLQHGKVASRSQILKKTTDFIVYMRSEDSKYEKDIVDLTRQNSALLAQIQILAKTDPTLQHYAEALNGRPTNGYEYRSSDSNTSSDSDSSKSRRKIKKIKVSRNS